MTSDLTTSPAPSVGPNPMTFGICTALVGAGSTALMAFGIAVLDIASAPPGALEPGPSLGSLSMLLFLSLFIGALAGLIAGTIAADRGPERAEQSTHWVYPLVPPAGLVVLAAMFLMFFIGS